MKTFFKLTAALLLAGTLCYIAFYKTPQERAFAEHLRQAKTGNTDSILTVAEDYLHGAGTPVNVPQAIEWYQQALSQGNGLAAWHLFQLYAHGEYVPADDEAALAYLQVAAQLNIAEAQYELGRYYEQGKQLPQHTGEALFWYLKSAQNHYQPAEEKLAPLQEDPLYQSVTRFWHILQQANQQDPQAQLATAQAYRYGTPILRNDESAFYWFGQAWENSHNELSQAAFELSDQYAKGEGVEKNENKATALLAQAAELKNPSAQYQLGSVAYAADPPRWEDAFAWFSNAATQGHAQAQYMTGFMLLQGQGTQKSLPLALRFFEQAAQQNDAAAQYVLGQIYTKGLGVKKNLSTGQKWLERAAENGNESARALLNPPE